MNTEMGAFRESMQRWVVCAWAIAAVVGGGCTIIFRDSPKRDEADAAPDVSKSCPSWRRSFWGAGDGTQTINSIAVDDDCHVYVCGALTGTFTYGEDGIASPIGGTDAFVARLDEEGKVVWAHLFGGPGDDDACTDIVVYGELYGAFVAEISGVRYGRNAGNGDLEKKQDVPGEANVLVGHFFRENFATTQSWPRTITSGSRAYSSAVTARNGSSIVVGITAPEGNVAVDDVSLSDAELRGKYLVSLGQAPTAEKLDDVFAEGNVFELAYLDATSLLVSASLAGNPDLGGSCVPILSHTSVSAHLARFVLQDGRLTCASRVALFGDGEIEREVYAGPFALVDSNTILWAGRANAESLWSDITVADNFDNAQTNPWLYRLRLDNNNKLAPVAATVYGASGQEEVTGLAFDEDTEQGVLIEQFVGLTDIGLGSQWGSSTKTLTETLSVTLDADGIPTTAYPFRTANGQLLRVEAVHARGGTTWYAGWYENMSGDDIFSSGTGAFVQVNAQP